MADQNSVEPLLSLDGVETCYGQSQVLFGVSFAIQPGEMVTLMGRNGMGKTTSVRSIMGLTAARAGAIRFMGEEIRGLPAYRIAQRGIGLVPEGRQIFPNLTVEENLIATASNHQNHDDPWTLEKVLAMFPELQARRSSMGNLLSGGEQQMVAMGRALMAKPKLLLMDEPSMGLAPILVEQSFEIIQRVHQAGVSILVVEQNANMALSIADYGYVLATGRIVLADEAAALAEHEELKKAYLGR